MKTKYSRPLLLLIVMISHQLMAQSHTLKNDEGINITLSDQWQKTLVAELFYDADFVFSHAQSKDLLIVESFPKGLFVTPHMPDDKQGLQAIMANINNVHASDEFLKAGEELLSVKSHQKKNVFGLSFTSKYQDAQTTNYGWLGNNDTHMLVLKIIPKTTENIYSDQDILSLVENIKIDNLAPDLSNDTKIVSDYGYDFYRYEELTETETDTDVYRNVNKAFSEEFALSAYTISSVCNSSPLADAVLNSVILENFGIDELFYSGNIIHNQQQLPIVISRYESDDDDPFHTISTIISKEQCQHVLLYVVEESEPLIDRFVTFVDHFVPTSITQQQFAQKIPEVFKAKYATTLTKIAKKLGQLKLYQQSGELYQQAYKFQPQADLANSIASNFNNQYQYQKGLEFIKTVEPDFFSNDLLSWQAWYFAKLDQPQKSVTVFEQVFTESYTTDEDFFKYIEQLSDLERYQAVTDVIEKYQSQVEDKNLLKKLTAKNLTKYDKEKAQTYIVDLLKDEQLLIDYQFELMDYLGDIEAYQQVVQFTQDRIATGYGSAYIYNYLGDAQNQLGEIESALASMTTAHEMAPQNNVIKSYYQSLLNKNGKADLTEISQALDVVELPEEVREKMNAITAKNQLDSYENLYTVIAYYHEKDKKNRRTYYEKFTINNDSGVAKNKTLKFRFDQEYEKIHINYLNVSNEDGLITSFDRSNAYISSDDDGYTADTDKLLNIPVPSLSTGVTLELAITIESQGTSSKQYFEDNLFVSSVATQYKAIAINGDLSNMMVDASDSLNHHHLSERSAYWDMYNLPNYKKTPLMPDYDQVFAFHNFSSVQPDWQTVGDQYLKKITKKINTPINKTLLNDLTKESTDIIENAQSIIAYVQKNISYQAIEFGQRAQIPNTSDQTLENKYGDCKDHSVLLHDMLNEAGIKAKLVLVNADSDINSTLPTSDQFNHMIVYLPEVNGGTFVDATDKDTTLNLMSQPDSLQGYQTLVLDEGKPYLKPIPFTKPGNNTFDIKRTVDKKDDHYIYHEQATITGVYASSLRNYLKKIELDELESKILAWVNGYYSDLTLVAFKHNNIYDNSQALVLDFTFKQEIENATMTLPIFIERYAMDFTKSPNRIWDFEFKNTYKVSSATTILNNKELKFKKINKKIDSHLMKLNVKSNKKTITFDSEVYNNRLPAKDYSQLIQQSSTSYKIMHNALIKK